MPNYFSLFDLPLSYEVDLSALNEKYENLSFAHHPDFYASAGPEAETEATRLSILLNTGYQTLLSPHLRAEHLLSVLADRNNHPQSTASNPARPNTDVTAQDNDDATHASALPPHFLLEALEQQEAIDAAIQENDCNAMETLKKEITAQYQELLDTRSAMFAEACVQTAILPSSDFSLLQQIRINLNCGRYLTRMLERIANPEANLLD